MKLQEIRGIRGASPELIEFAKSVQASARPGVRCEILNGAVHVTTSEEPNDRDVPDLALDNDHFKDGKLKFPIKHVTSVQVHAPRCVTLEGLEFCDSFSALTIYQCWRLRTLAGPKALDFLEVEWCHPDLFKGAQKVIKVDELYVDRFADYHHLLDVLQLQKCNRAGKASLSQTHGPRDDREKALRALMENPPESLIDAQEQIIELGFEENV